MKKKILGLDLGTNSIGWALVEQDFENKTGKILGLGSRIIPMDEAKKNDFGKGASISQTADRTKARITRRMYERHHLRRERLHRVLNVLGFLPEHYANDIDFEKHFGKFKNETETKLVWKKAGKKANGKDRFEFIFPDLFEEMLADFKQSQPDLLNRKNINGESVKIPYDWTIYYLRKKALTEKISKEALAWLILNFNQKRGYYQRGEEENENRNKSVEFYSLRIKDVKAEIKYILTLENGETYYRISKTPLFDWKDTSRAFILTTYLEKDGTIKKDKEGKEKRSFFLKEDLSLIRKKTSKSTKKKNEKVEEVSLKIIEVKEEKQENVWYSLELENGWIYRRESKASLFDWKDKVREFIVTTDLNDDGTVKTDDEGKESRNFRSPKEDDWTLIKKKTENDLSNYIGNDKKTKTVGTYIYKALLKDPTQKIIGKLVRTIERDFYKEELKAILEKQIELQPGLFREDLYNACVRELYKSNEAHQQQLNSKNSFVHLFLDDIIFYQRPLRSQKSSIGNCSLEFVEHKINKKDEKGNAIKNVFEKDENGNDKIIKEYLKVIPKSNPYYQEFRVWQWLSNLKIFTKANDEDVTNGEHFLKTTEAKEKLFEFLMSEKEVDHKKVLKYFFKDLKGKAQTAEIAKYRWNYVYDSEKDESKTYPMNETGYEIRRRLKEIENVPADFLKQVDEKEVEITKKNEQTGEREKTGKKMVVSLDSREYQLWHIIYSVTDKNEYEKALKTFAVKHKLDETSFVENFKNFKPFPSEYGAYSEKAIKKLLPLMRVGKYWNGDAIVKNSTNYFNNIQQLLEKLSKKEGAIAKEQKEKWNKDINRKLYDELNRFNDADISLFQGLQLHIAQYLVYGRHSENADSKIWKSINDLETFLKEFKQHSLRNPIVEQVITETLRVVKDIWKHFGKGEENFFDEIHIELGREMKNTADDRAAITKQVTENENTNQRIKLLLMELKNDSNIENVREYSPSQQEILKIYEDGVLNYVKNKDYKENEKTQKEEDEAMLKIGTAAQPTKSEITKYKLWLEQKYKSPYTGEIIPLSKLFTRAYEIEHIIPQSRYFDDSLSNKVICEAAVNKLKDNQLGLEFIKNHYGQKVTTDGNKTVTICTEEQYRKFIEEHYAKNKAKRNKLLLEDIPDKMIERQLNDTRYISKYISQLLSNIVRIDDEMAKKIVEEGEKLANKEQDKAKANKIREKAKSAANDDGVNSKNIIPVNGKITSQLKQDWGLNNVWNELILPRFERMNRLTNSSSFTTKNKQGHTIPAIPFELSKGFQMKRIDHRHHAMDALVIACTTRDHVNLLNNESAKSEIKRYDLKRKLKRFENTTLTKMAQDSNDIWIEVNAGEKEVPKEFLKPWATFTTDTKNALEKIVVSFKQNLRVINKATNTYVKIENGKKVEKKQKGINWAIRKSLHKETVYGKVYLLNETKEISLKKALEKVNELKDVQIIVDKNQRKIINKYFSNHKVDIENAFKDENLKNLKKVNVFEPQSATRLGNNLASIFKDVKAKDKAEGIIKKITDTGIKQILLNHLSAKENNPESAFSLEGIEDMNKNIISLNGNKFHQPIFKVRIYETVGSKFQLGQKGNKKYKYVEAAQSTNLYFAIYESNKKTKENIIKRSFQTIPLNEVIERQKQGLSPVPETNEQGHKLLFSLSPNDLVYVPTKDELESNAKIDFENLTNEQRNRIYKFTDGSGKMANFIPVNIASVLFNMNNDKQKKAFGKELFTIQNEIGVGSQGSKNENAITGEQIKSICIKLHIDRLGNISPASKNYSQNNTKKKTANEPNATYEKKQWTLKKFQSFDEMENDQLQHFASLTPEELLRNHKSLSMAVFGINHETDLNNPDRKIKFD